MILSNLTKLFLGHMRGGKRMRAVEQLVKQGRKLSWPSIFIAVLLWTVSAVQPSHGQVILDGPNVSGTVGLNGETFGSGNVYFYWSGGNVSTSLVNGDTDFSVRVEPDKIISASVSMNSFQGATNASVYQNVNNIIGPTSSATEPLQLNLTRNAGRIIGRVSVAGGSVSRVNISASKSISSNEYYSGYATATVSPFDAVLPFVTTAGVIVQGSATLRAAAGCDVPVTLTSQSVNVPLNESVTALWSFDLSNEQCNQGNIQGQVMLNGLGGTNTDAVINQRYVQVLGPVSRSQYTDASGNYVFSGLPPGSYYVYNYNYFNAPYGAFYPNGKSVAVNAGDLVTVNFNHSVGTVHAAIQPTGAWNLSNVNSLWVYFETYGDPANGSTYLGYSYDNPNVSTGNVDFVVPAGTTRLNNYGTYFYKNDGVRNTWQYLYNYFSNGNYPLQAVLTQGDRKDLGSYQPETSESLVVVQPANATVGLTSLRLTGFHRINDSLGRQIAYRNIDLTSNAIGTPQNSVAVLVRGMPGTYQMTATGQGNDGATYSKQFELVLGSPDNTPAGSGVVSPIVLVDESTGASTTGSITFGNVTSAGETTVSASGSGPLAPGGFRVFGAGSMLYYDIQTTATFDPSLGATVCLNYNDTGLNANQAQRLTLQHYACSDPQTNTGCAWENITSTGYPNTTTNEICGVTDSFSIFAILLPLDQDGDGIADAEDNCPAVPNANQANLDGDGMGDACDSDIDGDGVDDTADNCPLVANANQADLDGDGIGDACDGDIDGDSVPNNSDNCPVNANASQANFDGDGLGDACDDDDDNDNVTDAQDSCPGTPMGVLIYANGCSSVQHLELMCPSNGTYRNHGQYVQCVAHEAEDQVADGLITSQEKDAIVATAAKSDIGNK